MENGSPDYKYNMNLMEIEKATMPNNCWTNPIPKAHTIAIDSLPSQFWCWQVKLCKTK